jgi:hypothetical protein
MFRSTPRAQPAIRAARPAVLAFDGSAIVRCTKDDPFGLPVGGLQATMRRTALRRVLSVAIPVVTGMSGSIRRLLTYAIKPFQNSIVWARHTWSGTEGMRKVAG